MRTRKLFSTAILLGLLPVGVGWTLAAEQTSTEAPRDLSQMIEAVAEPLPEIGSEAFAAFVDRFANARVVLLGEETHGTEEFYRARSEITKKLVSEHGFTVVALEADWPDGARMDAFVRGHTPVSDLLFHDLRFPEWMWRNSVILEFLEDIRQINAELGAAEDQAGIYGLDLYSLGTSMDAVVHFLNKHDGVAAEAARAAYSCLQPWADSPELYATQSGATEGQLCTYEVATVLDDLRAQLGRIEAKEAAEFSALQNAKLVVAAEAYYRSINEGSVASWNTRDSHMFDTLGDILHARGGNAKAVVWAHNSHVGDASATQMGDRGEINIGQLAREQFGEGAVLVGFGTDRGTVTAASSWGSPAQTMQVRPALAGSVGELFRNADPDRILLDLRNADPELVSRLSLRRLERFIGVQYLPQTERWSHYAEASLANQFDAYLWFEQTTALEPLDRVYLEGLSEEHPFALPPG